MISCLQHLLVVASGRPGGGEGGLDPGLEPGVQPAQPLNPLGQAHPLPRVDVAPGELPGHLQQQHVDHAGFQFLNCSL